MLPFRERGVRGEIVLSEGQLWLKKNEALFAAMSEAGVGCRVAGGEGCDEKSRVVKLKHPTRFIDVGLVHAATSLRVKVRQSFQQSAHSTTQFLKMQQIKTDDILIQ
jgi:hypothetical protein